MRDVLMSQLLLSTGAATIEARARPMEPLAIAFSGMMGTIRFYEALRASDAAAPQHPRLEELIRMRDAGTLEAFVRGTLDGCRTEDSAEPASTEPSDDSVQVLLGGNQGFAVVSNGQQVQLQGPDCDRLLACCRAGAAAAGDDAGPINMMCSMIVASSEMSDEPENCTPMLPDIAGLVQSTAGSLPPECQGFPEAAPIQLDE